MSEQLKIDPKDIIGRFKFLADVNKSIKRTEGDTRIIKTEHGWLFPEDIQLCSDEKDEWLYAFGSNHIWRTRDVETWQLVK